MFMRPEVTVFAGAHDRLIVQETSSIVGWLRRFARVIVTDDPSAIRVTPWERAHIVVATLSDLGGPLASKLQQIVRHSPVIIIAPRGISSTLRTLGAWTGRLDLLDSVELRRRFPRVLTARLIDTLLVDALARVVTHPLLTAHVLLRERLMDALSASPPLRTVKAVARKGERGARWLDAEWAQVCRAAPLGTHCPQLAEIVKVILFLRGLSIWLLGQSVGDSAMAVGIAANTLASYFVQFTGANASEVDVEALPEVVLQVAQYAFGWLGEAEAATG
jgi:hypothetical protein